MIMFGMTCGFKATAQTDSTTTSSTVAETTSTTTITTTTLAPPTLESNKSADKQIWPSFDKAFEAGVASAKSKKYDEARLAFSQALEKEPNNIQALTNLALVQFQLGQKGWAVALLRKAHNLNPDFSTPKAALDFILPQLDVKEIPHEIEMWETIRDRFVVPFSLTGFLILTALCFFASGWVVLTYLGNKKRAYKEEKPLPPFPTIPLLLSAIFILMLSLTVLKIWDQGIPRGTVVAEKISVYSAPNEKSVALFDLFAGLEVVLDSTDANWVQVTYPGALTGWIPKSSVYQTSGRSLW